MSANPNVVEDNIQESPGGSPVGLFGIYLLLAYVLLFIFLVLYAMVKVWPPIPESEKTGNENANASATVGRTANVNQNTSTNTNRGGGGNSNTPGGGSAVSGGNTNGNGNGNTGTGVSNTNQNPPGDNNANSNVSANANRNANTNAGATTGGAVPNSEKCLDDKGNPRKGMAPASFIFFGTGCLYDEDRLLIIVALCGALGALVHVIRSLSWYIGQRKLYKSWTAMYFLLPFLGAAMALIFYLVVRGGFFSPNVEVRNTNPFGFAAMAALIGMFTDQALQRLKTVAENILMPAPTGKESAPPVADLSVTSINPRSGPSAGGATVAITGAGFVSGARVNFGGIPATSVVVSGNTAITTVTPAHAAGAVDVEVINPNNHKAILGGAYTYQ